MNQEMTMSEYGERIAPGAVRFRRVLPGPIERVWSYLTESDKRAQWFCAGETELRVGGRTEMLFDHRRLSPHPDDAPPAKYAGMPDRPSYTGQVTRCEPPRVLAYTWHEQDDESEVHIELREQGDQVVLVLTHTQLRTREDEIGVLGGWHAHLDILDDVLNGRVPGPFWKHFTPIELEYESRVADEGK
jgi:uncharacterized protein YndB with AHSA1/START domain